MITDDEIAKFDGEEGWEEQRTCSVCYGIVGTKHGLDPTPFCHTCAAEALPRLIERVRSQQEEIASLKSTLNNPQIVDFTTAVQAEAAHQRERWGVEHDAQKTDADWFWLIGYLAGKALHNPPDDSCKECRGDGWMRCKDPQCGEAYWDHDCAEYKKCSCGGPKAKQLHRIITVAAAAAHWHAAKKG